MKNRASRINLSRRTLLQGGAALGVGSLFSINVGAREKSGFPTRAITIITPMAAGGSTDIGGRMIAENMGRQLGQSLIVDNRPGAAGAIGAQAVANADPDGYTLLLAPSSVVVVNPLVNQTNYDVERDFRPVSPLATAETILVASAASGFKTLDDVIQQAKANPGKIAYGSNGPGSAFHLAGEYLQMLADIELLHVPYKGAAPAEVALMGGEISLMVTNTASALPHIRSGKFTALAILSTGASRELPDVPPATATVPGYVINTWVGLYAPAGTETARVDRINAAANAALSNAELAEALRARGLEPALGSAEDLTRFAARERKVWSEIVTAVRAKGQLS